MVAALLWSGDSATAASGSVPFGITDATGAFLLQSDTVDRGLVDSVLIQTVAPGCERRRLNTILPGSAIAESGVQSISITQPGIAPVASSRSDLICAYGIHPFWGPLSYRLALRFDTPGGTLLQGRWRINYRFSSADDEGSLVGAQTNDFVQLDLTHDNPSPACTSMRIFADIDTNGAWRPMRVIAQQGCVPEPSPFFFVEDTVLAVP